MRHGAIHSNQVLLDSCSQSTFASHIRRPNGAQVGSEAQIHAFVHFSVNTMSKAFAPRPDSSERYSLRGGPRSWGVH